MCGCEPSNPAPVLQPYIPSASALLMLPKNGNINAVTNKAINKCFFDIVYPFFVLLLLIESTSTEVFAGI
jgi:hypothetical protein